MFKKFITIVITLVVLFGLSFGATYFMDTKFIDFAFLIGMAVTALIWFFTSKGGFTTKNMDMKIQAQTGIKMEETKYELPPNLAFFTSLAYTVITLVITICYY